MGTWRSPLRVTPHPDEAMGSFLLRVALANHVGLPSRVLGEHHNSNPVRLSRENFSMVAVFARCGTDVLRPALIERIAVPGRPQEFQVHGVRVKKRYDLTLTRPRICRACIAAQGYAHFLWDFSMFAVCPIHRRRLQDTCRCGRKLSWNRRLLLTCGCGRPLGLPAVAEERPAHPALIVSQLIWNAAKCHPAMEIEALPQLGRWNADLAMFSVDELLTLVWFLGRYVETRGKVRRGELTRIPDVSEAISTTESAIKLLADWPQRFQSAINDTSTLAGGHWDGGGEWRTLRKIHRFVVEELGSDVFKQIRMAYIRSLRDHRNGAGPHDVPGMTRKQLEIQYES